MKYRDAWVIGPNGGLVAAWVLDANGRIKDAWQIVFQPMAEDYERRGRRYKRDSKGRFAETATSRAKVRAPLYKGTRALFVRRAGGMSFTKTLKQYQESTGNLYDAACKFCDEQLRGRALSCKIKGRFVEVKFTNKGLKEARKHMKNDPIKAELVPLIPEIIMNGRYSVNSSYKKRPDDISVFHSFNMRIKTSAGILNVVVDVAEHKHPKMFNSYNLVRENTRQYSIRAEHEGEEVLMRNRYKQKQRRKRTLVEDKKAPRPDIRSKSRAERGTFNKRIPSFFEFVNLRIKRSV